MLQLLMKLAQGWRPNTEPPQALSQDLDRKIADFCPGCISIGAAPIGISHCTAPDSRKSIFCTAGQEDPPYWIQSLTAHNRCPACRTAISVPASTLCSAIQQLLIARKTGQAPSCEVHSQIHNDIRYWTTPIAPDMHLFIGQKLPEKLRLDKSEITEINDYLTANLKHLGIALIQPYISNMQDTLKTQIILLYHVALLIYYVVVWGPLCFFAINTIVSSIATLCPIIPLAPASTILSLAHMVNSIFVCGTINIIDKKCCRQPHRLPITFEHRLPLAAWTLIMPLLSECISIISQVAGALFNVIQARIPFAPLFYISDGNPIALVANIVIITTLWTARRIAYDVYQIYRLYDLTAQTT